MDNRVLGTGVLVVGMCGMVAAGIGCSATASSTTMGKTMSPPQTVAAASGAYHEIAYDGRVYVIGSDEMAAKFEEHKHLPYTRTLLGAGPHGETVVFEVDNSDSTYVERLQQTYKARH